MTKVVLDQATLAKLARNRNRVEVCDEAGSVVGYFTPLDDRSLYESVQPPISEEELRRREQHLRGRPLSEILRDLETKA